MNQRPPILVRLAIHAVVYAAALTMLAPLLWMIATSLRTERGALEDGLWPILPRSPQWSNYVRAFENADLARYFLNSLAVALATTILAAAYNAAGGYALAVLRFRGRRAVLGLAAATMMLPPTASLLFAYLFAARLGLSDSLPALVVPFLASGFGILFMKNAIDAVPASLLEAGRLDGMRELDLLWSIVRPAIWPSIAALAILSFVNSWNGFLWPLVIIDSPANKTLPLAIAELAAGAYTQSWAVRMAAASIMTLPLVVVFLLFQRGIIRGMTLAGITQ